MVETAYLGDTKDMILPDEIKKIILSELQEVFPYIKDVKLEASMKYLRSTPFVDKLVWKPKKVSLSLYVDKSFENDIKKEQSEFYDFEKEEYRPNSHNEIDRYIDKFYEPWKFLFRYNLHPMMVKYYENETKSVGFEYV